MNNEQENKWREEFLNSELADSTHKESWTHEMLEAGYIAGRKKAQEEYDRLKRVSEMQSRDAVSRFNENERLEKEIDEMTKDRDRIHTHRAKLIEEITQLKEELKREREAVDFYAKYESWDETMMISDLDIEGFKLGGLDDYEVQAGYFARQTQQQRKVEL